MNFENSADNTIKIWNSKNGDLIKKLVGHKFPVRGLQVLADGNLASCAEVLTIFLRIIILSKFQIINILTKRTI